MIAADSCTTLPAVADVAPKPERLTLSRDYSVFLVELSIALHKHAMYPGDHPSLEPAAAGVARRAARLLEDREQISFGVAQQQLIIDGVATDPNQPVLRRLAEGLHRHHLGAITISRGLEPAEITAALHALAEDPEHQTPIGLSTDAIPAWPHLKLHRLTFDRLTLAGDGPLAPDAADKSGARGAELWIGLARAAMAAGDATRPLESDTIEPAAVARAIDVHAEAEAYDQVIVGYLLQIARELRDASGAEAAALRRRTGRLIAALKPETLRRLVEMGGDAAQRNAFVLDATHGMDVEAVLDIVKAAAASGGQTISHGLVRMLSKLAAHAESGSDEARPLADGALREQVGRLLNGWTLDDPNPERYGRLLQRLAGGAADPPRNPAAEDVERQDPLRVVQMGLEIGVVGALAERAIARCIGEGRTGALLDSVAAAPDASSDAARHVLTMLLQPQSIAALLATTPVDFDALDRLLPSLPAEGFEVLLDALTDSPDRATRRKLLDRLAAAGADIGPLAVARLEDQRWFVVRNMLALLERRGRVPPGFSASRWADHADSRVRRQAVLLQLTLPDERAVAIRTAIDDADPRIVRAGLTALAGAPPPSVLPAVMRISENPEMPDDVRALGARTLGRSREPAALQSLLRIVDGGRTLFGKPKLAPSSLVVLAALRAIAEGWSGHPDAAPLVDLAGRSPDPEIRRAVLLTER